jgi:hypothetical protein
MRDGEFVRQARVDWPDAKIDTVLEACEEYYMNGTYDDVSGDVEAPTGHFYRIGRYIVVTDSQGFSEFHNYSNENEAVEAFSDMDEEYAKWDGGE